MSRARAFRLPLLMIGCGAGAAALMATRELSARESLADYERTRAIYDAVDNTALLGTLSLLGGLAIIASAAPRLRALASRLRLRCVHSALWCALLLIASAAYFYGGRGLATPYYPWLWDTFHYVLGSKYHAELGYHALYDCTVQADREGRHVLPDRGLVRDLVDYRMVPLEAAAQRTACHDLFSAQRWDAFKRDLVLFQRQSRGFFADLLHDFGFNGTPLLASVTGRWLPLPALTFENVAWLCLVDVLAVTAILALVPTAFGEQLGAVFALFLLVNFADRFVHTGGSYFRFPWLLLLAGGIALLKRGHYRLAGACIATSGSLNVFPALFMVGPMAKLLSRRERNSPLHAARLGFLRSAFMTASGLLLATLAFGSGFARHVDFLSKMWMHVGLDNDERVGLKYMFAIGPNVSVEAVDAVSRHLPQDGAGYAIAVLAALAVAALLALLVGLDDVEASVLGGIGLLFAMFSTALYYYASLALLPLALHRRFERAGARALVGGIFLGNAAAYGVPLFSDYTTVTDNLALSWLVGTSVCATALYLRTYKPSPKLT